MALTRRSGPAGTLFGQRDLGETWFLTPKAPDTLIPTRHVGSHGSSGAKEADPINTSVQQAVARAGLDPAPYSAHSLRAGFVTYAHLCGAGDRAIAHQTRHRSLATRGGCVHVQRAWIDNAAAVLGL